MELIQRTPITAQQQSIGYDNSFELENHRLKFLFEIKRSGGGGGGLLMVELLDKLEPSHVRAKGDPPPPNKPPSICPLLFHYLSLLWVFFSSLFSFYLSLSLSIYFSVPIIFFCSLVSNSSFHCCNSVQFNLPSWPPPPTPLLRLPSNAPIEQSTPVASCRR